MGGEGEARGLLPHLRRPARTCLRQSAPEGEGACSGAEPGHCERAPRAHTRERGRNLTPLSLFRPGSSRPVHGHCIRGRTAAGAPQGQRNAGECAGEKGARIPQPSARVQRPSQLLSASWPISASCRQSPRGCRARNLGQSRPISANLGQPRADLASRWARRRVFWLVAVAAGGARRPFEGADVLRLGIFANLDQSRRISANLGHGESRESRPSLLEVECSADTARRGALLP